MTNPEFSNQFDVLVNSYTRFRDFDNKEPRDTIEFNEYEKSLYLTKAQEELVRGLYNGRNPLGESFEQTEELRRYLADLVIEAELQPTVTSNGKPLGMESTSKFFTLPEELWFITYEGVIISDSKCEGTTSLEVLPVTQNEYHRIKKNPFRGANDRRALRLDLSEGIIEIISKYTVTSYYLRYLRKLNPIILVDLPNEVSISGKNQLTECELNDGLHQRILELAVMIALQSKGFNVSNNNENR
jgi:hypothetical protein